VNVFESASILLHLATKYDAFIPKDANRRVACINWLFWLQGLVGHEHCARFDDTRAESPHTLVVGSVTLKRMRRF
jgi:glutathione S-transferase